MSLYRQPGRFTTRTLAIAVGATVVVAGGAGFGLGAATGGGDAPTIAAQVKRLSASLEPARDGLELVRTEYPQARGGEPSELAAAQADVKRVLDTIDAHADDLRTLNDTATDSLLAAVGALQRDVAGKSPVATVDTQAKAAAAALDALLPR